MSMPLPRSEIVPRRALKMKSQSTVAATQGFVYLGTGLWPLLQIESFVAVTGPKTDLWLVYTVGVIATVIGATLFTAVWMGRVLPEIVVLAVGTALAFAAIDIIFVSRGVIDSIYLADAVMELLFVCWWGVAARTRE